MVRIICGRRQFLVSHGTGIWWKGDNPYLEKSMGIKFPGSRFFPYDIWVLLNLPILRQIRGKTHVPSIWSSYVPWYGNLMEQKDQKLGRSIRVDMAGSTHRTNFAASSYPMRNSGEEKQPYFGKNIGIYITGLLHRIAFVEFSYAKRN